MRTITKYSNTIEYKLKTSFDNSGLTRFRTELAKTENQVKLLHAQDLLGDKQVEESLAAISKIRTALDKSFNTKLGMIDTGKLVKNLNLAEGSFNSLYTALSHGGTQGIKTFNQLYGQITKVDTGLMQVSKTTDKIFNTIGNTFRWGIIASGFSQIMNSAHQAAQYMRDLDESLTNIMMVTDYSRQQMNEYAKSANEAAKALGNTTVGVTNATLVFAQQGFGLDQSQQLANLSIKLANASQQDSAETSDQITAIMNSYKIHTEDLQRALDSIAEVANVSAADVQELAVAMKKSASTAATVGVSLDQLNAQIAAIETVTREAPENIGNGLKTIYARFSDISMGETLEDGVNLGKVTSTLEKVNVKVLDTAGNMRGVGDIMEDLMEV